LRKTSQQQYFGEFKIPFPSQNTNLVNLLSYTEALESSSDPTFQSPIYTKRAGTNLVLGRYDDAKADALASLAGGPPQHEWKAYYNAGRAAYGLCDYRTSHSLLSKALALNQSHSGIQREHARCEARLHEEETGNYDFPAMLASLTVQSVHLDRGSFLRNTRVADSAHHGRGLFAARDLAAGEIIFVEKATLMPNQYDPGRASAALYALTVRQLCDNPSLAEPVLGMYGGEYARSGMEGVIVDGVPVVDVFLVESIRTKNCFSSPRSTVEDTKPSTPSGRQAKGLWVHAAAMNHGCVANSMRSFVGDMLISRATRDIKEGEEIFQQYVPVKSLVDARSRQYLDGWGFECRCKLCVEERRSPEANLAKRKEALMAVEKVCNKKLPGKGDLVPDATIRNVERLTKQLEDLHEAEVYAEGLPRLTLIYPCNWLVGAHKGRKNHAKVVRYAKKVLRCFGFIVPEDEGAEWDPRKMYSSSGDATLMTVHVVVALRRLAEAYEALGEGDMAKKCVEAAKFGYMLVTGFENDLSMLDR
jgi:tetratricopeptide (TPR) repeat protein